MADNYLGKKFEDLQMKRKKSVKVHPVHKSLDSLLLKNRSCRGYDSSYKVSKEELREIVSVNTLVPSARNQQVLRFKLLVGFEAEDFCKFIKLGGALPELHLPFPGTEPNAFIIICTSEPLNRWTDIDLGISAQSMLLKAVDMGLNGICIGAFDKAEAERVVGEGMTPLLVIAIGKSAEKYQILHIGEKEDHRYFRENGIHYVPKVKVEDLIIR